MKHPSRTASPVLTRNCNNIRVVNSPSTTSITPTRSSCFYRYNVLRPTVSITFFVVVHDRDFRPVQEIYEVPERLSEVPTSRKHVRDEVPCVEVRHAVGDGQQQRHADGLADGHYVTGQVAVGRSEYCVHATLKQPTNCNRSSHEN